MFDDILDLLNIRSALFNGFFSAFDRFVGDLLRAVMLKFFSNETGLSNSFGDFFRFEVYDFTITFNDFFEHKKYYLLVVLKYVIFIFGG